jgi:hypothetical protein
VRDGKKQHTLINEHERTRTWGNINEVIKIDFNRSISKINVALARTASYR